MSVRAPLLPGGREEGSSSKCLLQVFTVIGSHMLEACWVQAQKCHNEAHDCVCACVCAHVCPGICTCVYMRAGQQLYWLSLTITLCRIISLLSEADLSLNLERAIFATLASR